MNESGIYAAEGVRLPWLSSWPFLYVFETVGTPTKVLINEALNLLFGNMYSKFEIAVKGLIESKFSSSVLFSPTT